MKDKISIWNVLGIVFTLSIKYIKDLPTPPPAKEWIKLSKLTELILLSVDYHPEAAIFSAGSRKQGKGFKTVELDHSLLGSFESDAVIPWANDLLESSLLRSSYPSYCSPELPEALQCRGMISARWDLRSIWVLFGVREGTETKEQ